jgi:hypothetical protein
MKILRKCNKYVGVFFLIVTFGLPLMLNTDMTDLFPKHFIYFYVILALVTGAMFIVTIVFEIKSLQGSKINLLKVIAKNTSISFVAFIVMDLVVRGHVRFIYSIISALITGTCIAVYINEKEY